MSFKDYDLSYMVVSEEQITALKTERETVEKLVDNSGVKKGSDSYNLFERIFKFE